ncbi:MAG TPA: flagellar hook-length control protein FliK, partial [Candidatus Kapabacteria bacterium]|nr:flagellar hook-length control protein FliK [Candidatus Kapabacteria bacterium]
RNIKSGEKDKQVEFKPTEYDKPANNISTILNESNINTTDDAKIVKQFTSNNIESSLNNYLGVNYYRKNTLDNKTSLKSENTANLRIYDSVSDLNTDTFVNKIDNSDFKSDNITHKNKIAFELNSDILNTSDRINITIDKKIDVHQNIQADKASKISSNEYINNNNSFPALNENLLNLNSRNQVHTDNHNSINKLLQTNEQKLEISDIKHAEAQNTISDNNSNFDQSNNNFNQSNNFSQFKHTEHEFTNENLGIISQQPMSSSPSISTQQISENTAKPLIYNIKLGDLPNKISSIISKSTLGEVNTARINLSPKSLGTLVVEITQKKDDLKIVIHSESKDVANLIEQNLSGLKDKLINQGFSQQNIDLNINVQSQANTLMNRGDGRENNKHSKNDRKYSSYSQANDLFTESERIIIDYNKYDSGKFIEKYI